MGNRSSVQQPPPAAAALQVPAANQNAIPLLQPGNIPPVRANRMVRPYRHHRMVGQRQARFRYSQFDKDNAVRLLNMGMSYRAVARQVSERCSCGTTYRWRREAIRNEQLRQRMEDQRRERQRNW